MTNIFMDDGNTNENKVNIGSNTICTGLSNVWWIIFILVIV